MGCLTLLLLIAAGAVLILGGLPTRFILAAEWWQGVAGMAQIVAAFLAVYSIRQGTKMLREAERQREAAVAPVVSFVKEHLLSAQYLPSGGSQTVVELRNVGSGPALNTALSYAATNGIAPRQLFHSSQPNPLPPIEPQQSFFVTFDARQSEQLAGTLFVKCTSRFGTNYVFSFCIRTWADDSLPRITVEQRAPANQRQAG